MSEHPSPAGREDPDDIAARVARLERENADLRARLVASSEDVPAGAPPRRRHRGRAFGAAVLVTIGLLLAPVAVVASWAEQELTDTDRYVATVGPLAADPAIQSAVAAQLTALVMERADVATLVNEAVATISDREGFPDRVSTALTAMEKPLTDGIESFVRRAADRVVSSDAFDTAWVEANRVAHEQLVAVMQGREDSTLQIGADGQLTIQLAGVIKALKDRLVADGFGIAANIPEVDASFTLVQSTQLVRARNAYDAVRLAGTWLPWLSLGLIAAGVLTARNRPRTLVVAGCGLAVSMLVLALGLYVGRTLYLGALTGTGARLDAAEAVFDQVVLFIRVALRTVAVAGLVVALAAYLGGGSASARRLRTEISRGFASVRSWAEHRGATTGPVGTWLGVHKGLVRAVIIAATGLVVLLARSLTPGLVLGAALVAAVHMALVELVARPPSPPAEAGGDGPVEVRGTA